MQFIAKTFAAYVVACVVFDCVRKMRPDALIQPEEADALSPEQRSECITLSLTNLIIGAGVMFLVTPWIVMTRSANTDLGAEVFKLLAMFFVADTMFYWTHRFLHIPAVYCVAHKLHHCHHSPIPWTSLYVHPIEFTIALMGIFLIPLFLFSGPGGCGVHSTTALVFLFGIVFSLVASHSGVKLPFSDATHHDLHHQQRRGNYGADIGVWDRICGTELS